MLRQGDSNITAMLRLNNNEEKMLAARSL